MIAINFCIITLNIWVSIEYVCAYNSVLAGSISGIWDKLIAYITSNAIRIRDNDAYKLCIRLKRIAIEKEIIPKDVVLKKYSATKICFWKYKSSGVNPTAI